MDTFLPRKRHFRKIGQTGHTKAGVSIPFIRPTSLDCVTSNSSEITDDLQYRQFPSQLPKSNTAGVPYEAQ
jgi:hypothetical protein